MLMKNWLLSVALVMLTSLSFGQQPEELVVEPGDPGVLNLAVARHLDSVIYVLQRGEYYFLTERISTEYPLYIKAEDGDGPRPIIQCLPDQEGANFALFSLGGNTLFEDLYITGYDALGNLVKNIFRVDVDSIKFMMENCFIDYDQQCPTRINVQGVSVRFNNCTFRNISNVNDPNNGRIVDTRSNYTDSISITNSTIYHTGDLLLRTADGALNFFEFDHNTVYLTGEAFDVGMIKNVKITNNILYNVEWQGADSIPNVGYIFSFDSVGTTGAYTDAEREFDLSHNNLYMEQSLIDIINSGKRTIPVFTDSVGTAFIAAGQVDTTGLISEMLVFDNPPPPVDEYLQVFHDNYGIVDAIEVPNFWADADPLVPGEDDYTFNYTGVISVTGSDTGGPLGDPKWTATAYISGLYDRDKPIRPVICYPNPAVDIINMKFNLVRQSDVTVQLFDVLGRIIKSVDYKGLPSGTNTIPVEIGKIDAGHYMYKLYIDNTEFDTGRILVK